MLRSESNVTALKRHDVRLIAYLPDFIVQRLLTLLAADAAFRLPPVGGEEECVGIMTDRTCLRNSAGKKGQCGLVPFRAQLAIYWF